MTTPTTSLEVVPPQIPEYTEQNVSMVQQYATARIQSAYMVALQRPRQVEVIRQDVLKECKRPSFCAPDDTKNGSSLAIYRVPRGSVKKADGSWESNNIQGPTIRFAEMLLRAWKYLSIEVNPMGEDDHQRLLQVICTDYQSCNFTSEIVTVPKTVERKKTKPMDEIISQRTNSYGDPLYIVKATDDELAMRTNALVSKARRNLILQAVPGWLIEEAIDQVRETARTKDAQDPDAAKRKLYDAFGALGVTAAQLDEYLGHTNALSPAELEDLRGYYSGIREGFTTWSAVIAAKEETKDGDGSAAAVDTLLAELEMTPAQARKAKAKYAGNPAELVKYLEAQVAKKKNDGGKKEEAPANPTPTASDSPTAAPHPTTSSAPTVDATPDSTVTDAKPPQDAKKSPAAPVQATLAAVDEDW